MASTEVYRIRRTLQTSASSSSTNHITVYTDEATLAEDLLTWSLDMDRWSHEASRSRIRRVLADFWAKNWQGFTLDHYPYPTSIVVEKHISDGRTGEGMWVPINWSYKRPNVILGGVELS